MNRQSRPILTSINDLRAAGLLEASCSDEDGERLISYAQAHNLQCDRHRQECFLIDEGGGLAIAVTAPAFFRICAETGLWRPGRVAFQVLDEPVGLICIASCFVRDEGETWREVSDHARLRDFTERSSMDNPQEVLDPKAPATSLWKLLPTRMLQEAAEVQAAIKGLGDVVGQHLPDHHETACLSQCRYLMAKGISLVATTEP